MKEMRRVLALVLCFVMLVGVLPVGALAAEAETTAPSEVLETQAEEAAAAEAETTEAAEIETSVPETTAASEEEAVPEELNIIEIGGVSMQAADANDGVDYLFVATDRHTNTSIIGNIINNMETYIGENELDYLALGGDMVGSGDSHPTYNSSTVLSEVTGATSSLSATNVDIVAGIHDMNVTDDTTPGIVLPYSGGGAEIYEGTNFYVYGVAEGCISGEVDNVDPATEAAAFVTWANSVKDTSKVIIVVSHYPLHAKRGDNIGAGYWHNALNTVATGSATGTAVVRDVVFFHGHNHTVDPNEYCYAPGSTMSIESYVSPDGTATAAEPEVMAVYDEEISAYANANGTNATIYYTYATAGYLNKNSKATLVTINDDTIALTKYTTSGEGIELTSVARVAEAVTLDKISVTTLPTKTVYKAGDELDTTGMVVTGSYSDGTTKELSNWYVYGSVDMSSVGEKEVTIAYSDNGTTFKTTFKITVEQAVADDATLTGITVTPPTKTEYWVGDALKIDGMTVTASFSDGSTVDLQYFSNSALYGGYELDGFNMSDGLTEGKQQSVTVTYTYGDVTATGTFTISVWTPTYTDTTGVSVTVTGDYGITGATVAESKNENVADAIADVISGIYAAYDISLIFDEDYSVTETVKTVTLPIPDGVTNPVVYYVSDDGKEVTNMNATKGDGVVTFETTHFSTYIVGESTAITVPEPETATGKEDVVSSEEKEVYVLVSYISAAGDYLIVDTGSATTSANMLTASSNGVTNTSNVTVVTGTDANGNSVTYIADPAAAAIWTASSNSSGYRLYNSSTERYLRYSSGLTTTGNRSDATTWNSSNNAVFKTNNGTRYIRYNNGWSTPSNSNSATVYIYQKQTVSFATTNTVSGTYSIEGKDVSVAVVEGSTYNLTSTLIFKTESGAETTDVVSTTADYEIVTVDVNGNTVDGDPENIISTIEDNVITFTGKYGTALVKVSYTTAFGVVTDYITVTATAPYYSINLHKAELTQVEADATYDSSATYYTFDETTNTYQAYPKGLMTEDVFAEEVEAGNLYTVPVFAGDEITTPIALKGIIEGDTYSVWAIVKEFDGQITEDDEIAAGEDGHDMGSLGSALSWYVSDTSIATINTTTGLITFTGTNYGTFNVTVAYEGPDGKIVTDTITISVTDSLYIVPGDATNDFPQYPQEGAVRINKTAEAVGSYSETGIALVELSMTGVPYSTGSEIDVVIMLDMTGSMSDTAMTAAEEAAIAFAESIVVNQDQTYNNNRISVMAFNSDDDSPFTYWELGTVTADQWDSFCEEVRKASDNQASGGTPYDEALSKCQAVLQAAKTDGIGDNRQQFCVFMSDGGPTSYKYITNYDAVKAGTATSYNSSTATATGGQNQSDDNFATIATYTHEYYSTLMKDDGVTMYSVLTGLSAADYPNCTTILQNIATDSSKAYVVEDGSDTSTLSGVLSGIGMEIKQAATNVQVYDEIGDMYTLNFSIPTDPNGDAIDTGNVEEFYIQVVEYTLDTTTHERTNEYTVVENFTFNADGTLNSHTVNGTVTCDSNCEHVSFDDAGGVTYIGGTYFTYEVGETIENVVTYKDENGEEQTYTAEGNKEYLTWNVDKLTEKELALQYFAHLDNSSDATVDNQVPPSSYYTNEEATVTYTNFQGNEVQLTFPKPQMTWNGAQVTYRFYLVNENGQPVNRSGKVVPFTEAVWVTDAYTHAVTWNDLAGTDAVFAQDVVALANVPGVYTLYDDSAAYSVRVYQVETVDGDDGTDFNYFQISGANDKQIDSDDDDVVDESTTKVFNVQSGTRYDAYGVYSHKAKGTDVGNGLTVNYQTTDIDYGNTTVAFAVLWTPSLKEDTVIVDYGLDVQVNVATNDMADAKVVGVTGTKPDAEINTGTYNNNAPTTAATISASDGHALGKASVVSNTAILFSQSGMEFTEPAVIYYETEYTWQNVTAYQTDNMYSSLTVIPATTVYYEDTFLTLTSFSKADGSWSEDKPSKWTTDGKTISATQDVDRPGERLQNMTDTYDADNPYGYDSSYDTSSTYSLGSAQKITVDANTYGEATFSFYGTGFDVISMSSSDTGTITVKVTDASGTTVRSNVVDTYYGYDYLPHKITHTYTPYKLVYQYGLPFRVVSTYTPEKILHECTQITKTVYEYIGWTVQDIEDVAEMGESQEQPENPEAGTTYEIFEVLEDGTIVKTVYKFVGEWVVKSTEAVIAEGDTEIQPEDPEDGATYTVYEVVWTETQMEVESADLEEDGTLPEDETAPEKATFGDSYTTFVDIWDEESAVAVTVLQEPARPEDPVVDETYTFYEYRWDEISAEPVAERGVSEPYPENPEIGDERIAYQYRWAKTAVKIGEDEIGTDEAVPANPEAGDTYVTYEYRWVTVDRDNALYQVPVITTSGLPYGKYNVTIKAAYNSFFDHNTDESNYILILDAIRIYDPAGVVSGVKNETVSDAYKADGESAPVYAEIRNMLIDGSYAFGTAAVEGGAIFIDSNEETYDIAEYTNYGPNNELYLASGQAVSFTVAANSTIEDVQIGMKSADGSTVEVSLYVNNNEINPATIGNATDMYYSIGSYYDTTADTTFTFENAGGGIVSLTNLKITFGENATSAVSMDDLVYTSAATASLALMTLNAEPVEEEIPETEPEVTEPEVVLDADLEVSVRDTSVKVGSSVKLKVTTSANVESITVNGKIVTKYTENSKTGERTWNTSVKADEVGNMDVVVTAYSANGDALQTVTETVEVAEKNTGTIQQIIGQLIGALFR